MARSQLFSQLEGEALSERVVFGARRRYPSRDALYRILNAVVMT